MKSSSTLLFAALVLYVSSSCGSVSASWSAEYDSPFALDALFAVWEAENRTEGVEVRMEVLDAAGEGIPFSLIEIDWLEGGRTAFQSDEVGVFWLRFGTPSEVIGATIWPRLVSDGHRFPTEDYTLFASPLEEGSVKVSLFDYESR